jgi:DNA ligase-1
MNSNDIYALIERIAATPAKNAKIAMLAEHAADEDLKRVLVYALSPGRTYGIARRPEASGADASAVDVERERCAFDAQTWALLDALAERSLSGNAARSSVALEMDRLSPESAELLWRVIACDLRAGFSDSTVNKAIKDLIPEAPYMRCSLPKSSNIKSFPWERGVYSQKKANGMFANLDVFAGGEVRLHARSGNAFPAEPFAALAAAAATLLGEGHQHHGELLVVEGGRILPRQIGNGILTSVAKGGAFGPGQAPLYEVWDRIPLSAVKPKGSHAQPYHERLAALRSLLGEGNAHIRIIDTRIAYSLQEAVAHCVEVMAEGEEGTIVKSPDLQWRDATSKDAVKLKVEACCDLKVDAILPGRAGTKVEGRPAALACSSGCDALKVDVNVKNEAMRDAIEANPSDYIGRIVSVLFNEVMLPSASNELHSLFLPRLAEGTYRIDKSKADTLERVFEQYEAAKTMEALLA